ncbi:ABC transporter substrate-binding protein [Psychromicrobium xiongbiense]|uniref:ABC transporter substrate-binding protein n=1 Tax=Psychromicrobium xiongbiense TaxID=3051184 RepID=UPI002557A4E7|nr:ABC transporter substrate-binding protein [Psychromicrobium sp. YIM S02556]
MSTKKWVLTASAVALFLVAATGCADNASGSHGQQQVGDANGQQIKIMVGGLSKQIYLPFKLADQLGYYKDAGLNVQLSDEPAGVDAETNMISGQVDGVGGFYDHNQVLQAKGKATVSVISMLQVPGEVELCRSDLKGKINSAADWKGLNLGITDQGSSTDYLTQYIAQQNGVAPESTHRIGVQAGTTFIAAMDHKDIDCGMTTEPTVSQLINSNKAFVLYDSRDLAGSQKTFGGAYPATSLYMTQSYVDSHKDLVQKLVNVYVKTLKYIQDHTAAQITDQVPADYYAGVGKDAYIKALDAEKGMYNPTGVMPADGPKIVNAVLQANPDVKGKTIDLAKTFTDEFVKAAK